MKKNYIWGCNYDVGYGDDREACFAGAKRPMTKEAAERAAARHDNKNWHGSLPSGRTCAVAWKVDLRQWRRK